MPIAALAFALGSSLRAAEPIVKVHDFLELADGIYSTLWQFTVEPREKQLVIATFWIDVDQDLDLDDAQAKATKAGIKLPEFNEESWSVTLPNNSEPAKQEAGGQAGTLPQIGRAHV